MENRLELNKRPTYELPGEVVIGEYRKNVKEPDFEPDICINTWGDILGEIIPKKSKSLQIWIKTGNQDLINFIRNFNWYSVCPKHNNSPVLNMWKFKKIILEEFYGDK